MGIILPASLSLTFLIIGLHEERGSTCTYGAPMQTGMVTTSYAVSAHHYEYSLNRPYRIFLIK